MGWYLGYIIVYFLIMFGIGFYYFLKVKNAADYLIGGWSMGFWPIVGTVISTWCGASVFIGTVGLGFQVGASGYIRFSLASVIFTLILILAFGRALRRQRLYTLADLFGQRFGVRAGIIPSLLSAVVYAIPTTAMQYLAMSTIWSACFGMDVGNALVLSAVLVLAFTVLGGLPGTIVTDALQAVLIITGIVILAVASVSLAGGMGPMLAATPPEFLSPSGPYGAKEAALFFISVGMLLDVGFLVHHLDKVFLFAALLIFLKSILSLPPMLLVGYPLRVSILAAMSLAQIGEFSFVLARSAVNSGLMDNDLSLIHI